MSDPRVAPWAPAFVPQPKPQKPARSAKYLAEIVPRIRILVYAAWLLQSSSAKDRKDGRRLARELRCTR